MNYFLLRVNITEQFWVIEKNKNELAPVGIEPKTFALLARRSNQLSYGAVDVKWQIYNEQYQFSFLFITVSTTL